MESLPEPLKGKKGLVVGIANERSIAADCAKAFAAAGAALAVTYLNDKAKPHVAPVVQAIGAEIFMPLDVESDGELESVFSEIEGRYGFARAASGIARFDALIEEVRSRAPKRRHVGVEEVGARATCLVSDYARSVNGNVAYGRCRLPQHGVSTR